MPLLLFFFLIGLFIWIIIEKPVILQEYHISCLQDHDFWLRQYVCNSLLCCINRIEQAMKQLISNFKFSLFVLVFLCVVQTVSAYDFKVDGVYYSKIDDTSVRVTCKTNTSSNDYSGDIVIPATVEYDGIAYFVREIGAQAFINCSNLNSVVISEGVESVNYMAFGYCSNLTSVSIPESVTTLGGNVFRSCRSLTEVVIPDSVQLMGSYCFYFCSGLTRVHLPEKLSEIGTHTFDYCTSLTDVNIPDGVKTIKEYAFVSCKSLKHLTIPQSVTSIEKGAFSSCYELESINIPDSITAINDDVFFSCQHLSNITIPRGITSIGFDTFAYCRAFSSLTIPAGVTSIDESSFRGCSNLESIHVEEGNPVYDSRDNCNAIIVTATNKLLAGCRETVIPNTVTAIGNYSFYECYGLETITIPESVLTIGSYSFCGCPDMQTITIPVSITSMGEYAIYSCESLTELIWNSRNCATFGNQYSGYNFFTIEKLTIGDEVESLPEGFMRHSKISELTIPYQLTSMGDYVFDNCPDLKVLHWNARACANTIYDKSTIEILNIGDGVEELPNNFLGGSQIRTLFIPKSVRVIGRGAFGNCMKLESVSMPSVVEIGDHAFSSCKNLKRVRIPDSLALANQYSFAYCYALRDVTIGRSVEAMQSGVFYKCDSIVTVTSMRDVPPRVTGIFFSDSCLVNATLRVPRNSLESYRTTYPWKLFEHIVEFDMSVNGDANGDGQITIGDVTLMIDCLLGGEQDSFYFESADFDQNGVLSIGDVTALLDYLLMGGN